ncbi:hypothetical protein ACHAXH_003874 [Discostella pseudostelligera]|jgi:hypothetical protein
MDERADTKTPLLDAEIEMSDTVNHTHPAKSSSLKRIANTSTPTSDAENTLQDKRGDVEQGNAVNETDKKVEGEEGEEGEEEEGEYVYQAKQGHKFLFCCCDTKRAVVLLNYVALLFNILTFTAAIMNGNRQAETFVKDMVMQACGMFIIFTTLLGAYWYSKTIVSVGLIYACYHLTVGIMNMAKYNWQGENEDGKLVVILPFLWYILTFYAEAMFILELHDGTMSPETYKIREQYSCCCL